MSALDADGHYRAQRLLVVTPDVERLPAVDELGDPRVVWTSFTDFSAALRSAASRSHDWDEPNRPIANDRERELISELVQFLKVEKLTESVDDQVLVVAARIAFDEYTRHGVYFCQPYRSFRRCSRIACSSTGAIQPVIPRVLEQIKEVHMDVDAISSREDISVELRGRLAELRSGWARKVVRAPNRNSRSCSSRSWIHRKRTSSRCRSQTTCGMRRAVLEPSCRASAMCRGPRSRTRPGPPRSYCSSRDVLVLEAKGGNQQRPGKALTQRRL